VFREVTVSVVSLACVGSGATCWCVRVLVCGVWGTLSWCAFFAEGLGAVCRRRVSIVLQYSLEYSGGRHIFIVFFFF
jgi:hypothetical protein